MHLSFIYKPQRDVTVLSSIKFTGCKAAILFFFFFSPMPMYWSGSIMRDFPSRLVLVVLIVHITYISVSPVALPKIVS